jgi:hypothetical protein
MGPRFGCLLLAVACAHGPPRAPRESLKPAAQQFHERIRWKDFTGASDLIVPERREQFRVARSTSKDERDLSITDFELDRIELSPDGTTARVSAHLKWVKLPSNTEQDAVVVSEFVDYRGTWLLARQEHGPFDDLSEPYAGVPDAG